MTSLRRSIPLSVAIVALAVALPFTPASLAQTPPQREPQAIAALAQSFAAMGGPNLVAVQDTEMQVQVTSPARGSTTFTMTIKTLGNRSWRTEATTDNGLSVMVVNEKGGAIQVGSGEPQFVSRHSVANGGTTHVPVLSILSDWNDPTMRLEYLGLETLGGASVHRIRLTPQLLTGVPRELETASEVFVDSQSGLVLKLVYLSRKADNLRVSVPIEVTYGDYRAAAGIAVPFRVTYSLRGEVLREHQVTGFAVNRGFQPSDFELRRAQ